jgi:midasin
MINTNVFFSILLIFRYRLPRALLEGFSMSFLTQLEPTSCGLLKQVLLEYLASTLKQSDLRSAPGRPGGKKSDKTAWVLCEKVWLPLGPLETLDLSVKVNGRSKYVMTPSVQENLYRLCCCVAVQRYPVLLQGRRRQRCPLFGTVDVSL